ncbi:DNA-binding transcriptional regulator, XRE-family HTH domain [Gemmobacter aquatilis]|uniref:DNA-binding transcriptional regulator, XRE-family HTH domain n=1 Tax=Gemmobacter aquatilis TaxID=933059 RepID=A0A1H8P001_9RHOB|nr:MULTISPECIES: helix-turn-helix transcriptional regulator [Paracoccaceae]MWP40335.1 helix-turn-helix domain-containing protein [Cereibacter sphaeroides]SEO35240.1 DNA-binding transcriptional regulator, XRE-family HTH domain [Gemmobacter aquatilis]
MTGVLEILGKRVREKREELGLSQEALADVCSFDRTYVSLIERGKRNISLVNLVRIAIGLNTSVSQLTEGIEDGSYPKR